MTIKQLIALRREPSGFTLIELLVVIAIIGILSTLAVVALNSARLKARDSQRVANIKQVQTALELFNNDNNGAYPAGSGIILGDTSYACLNNTAFTTKASCGSNPLMEQVPKDPTSGQNYVYSYVAGPPVSYTITFNLEGQAGGFASGPHTATPGGVQ